MQSTLKCWGIVLCSIICIARVQAQSTKPAPIPIEYDPNAPLSAEDAERLVNLGLQVLDRDLNSGVRLKAAEMLGYYLPHRAAIPILRKVVQDISDDNRVRANAIGALSRIPDNSVIPIIIDLVSDPSSMVRLTAVEQLRQLSGIRQPEHPAVNRGVLTEAEIDQVRKYWREWWDEAKETFVHDRARMLTINGS